MIAPLMIVLGLMLSTSQPPTPAPPVVGQEEQPASPSKSPKVNPDGSVPKPAPTQSAVPAAAQPTAEGHDADNQSNNQASEDWRIVLFTGILTLVAILQFIAMFVQSNYMRGSLAQTTRSVDLNMLQQRAWLTVEIREPAWLGPHGDVSDLGVCEVVITNCGLTPATKASIQFNGHVGGTAGLEDQLPSKLSTWRSSGQMHLPDMAPRAEHRLQFPVSRDGKQLPFITGVAEYQHSAGVGTGSTWFCVQFADQRKIYREGENQLR
jgi:hypothetical protein